MNKTQTIIALTLGILAAASATATIVIIINTQKPEEPTIEPEPTLNCPMIDGVVAYAGETDKTALDILTSICEIETRTSANGTAATVTSIDKITATPPDYWALYINDTYALSSPNQLETTATDTIKWQLESIGNTQ
jgi:hypothetical protein